MPDPTLIITDTSCLIALTKIGAMDVLRKLYSQIAVTDVIADEFGEPLPEWIEVHKVANVAYQRLLEATLNSGEASAIALAIETDDTLLMIDDLKARKEAMRLGLKITGTLGVLFKAKEAGVIPKLAPLLEALQQAGFRVAPGIIDEILIITNEI